MAIRACLCIIVLAIYPLRQMARSRNDSFFQPELARFQFARPASATGDDYMMRDFLEEASEL